MAFELLGALATQDRGIRAVSPWQDDPFNAVTDAALFFVPVGAGLLAIRLRAWHAPGAGDRIPQMLRAAGLVVFMVAVAEAFEWSSVALGERARGWDCATVGLIAALTAATLGTILVACLLRRHRASAGRWEHDWLADAELLARRLPLVRRWDIEVYLAAVRRHVPAVCAALSLAFGLAVAGVQAIGEGWSDPLLIAWATAVGASLCYAACAVGNAWIGVIAELPTGAGSRATRRCAVAAALAVPAAEAFHDQLWEAIAGRPVPSVGVMAGLTLGAGVACAAVTALVLAARAAMRGVPPG